MALFSSYESLTYVLEEFINEIYEIEEWYAAWPEDEQVRANIKTVDSGMTNKACILIIVGAEAVHAAAHLVQTAESGTLKGLLANGIGIDPWHKLEGDDQDSGVSRTPTERQLRVALKVLGDARLSVQTLIDNLFDLLTSGRLGPHARLWLEDHVAFHLKEIHKGFLMLQGLLVHGLGRRFADVPILIYQIERLMSELKSIFTMLEDCPHK